MVAREGGEKHEPMTTSRDGTTAGGEREERYFSDDERDGPTYWRNAVEPRKPQSPVSRSIEATGSGNEHNARITSQVPATFTAGTDGALWVTVGGADVQQLAASINEVCDVLIPEQHPKKSDPFISGYSDTQ
jgi:hypothetical protein